MVVSWYGPLCLDRNHRYRGLTSHGRERANPVPTSMNYYIKRHASGTAVSAVSVQDTYGADIVLR